MQRQPIRPYMHLLTAGALLGSAMLFSGAASAHGGHRQGLDHDERAQLATADLILRAVVGNARPTHYRGHPHRFARPGYYRHGRFYAYPRYGLRPLVRHHRLHKGWQRRHERWDDRRHRGFERREDRHHRRDDRWHERKGRRGDRRDGRRHAH